MKCLECKYIEIQEDGFNGKLGESIITCKMCNKINSIMEDCEDFVDVLEYKEEKEWEI